MNNDNTTYYYKVVSTDGSDNQSESDEDTFLTLLNPPIVTSHDDNQAVKTQKVKLKGTAEPNATIFIQVNSSDEITTTANANGKWTKDKVALEEGENTISIKAENDDGDKSRTIILTLYLDTEPPTATIWTNYDTENPSLNFTVEWLSSEPDCTFKVKYRVPGESSFSNLVEPGTSSTSQDFHASGNGTYEFKAKATDLAGNTPTGWSEVVEVEVEVEDTIPPVITLIGELTVNLAVGDDYIDEGTTAEDDVDGDLTESIVVETR